MFDELNARQSEILREIPQKASPKPRKSVRCSLRNVKKVPNDTNFRLSGI